MDTLKEIRANPAFKKIYIIIFSTSNLPEEKKSLLQLGANSYYTKPADYDKLLETVKQIHVEVCNELDD